MQTFVRGLAAALLCVSFFQLTGCSGRQDLYLSGLEQQVSMSEDETAVFMETEAGYRNTERETESETVPEYVYVCGAVCVPGVYPIQKDMRVFEAVALAGGFTEQADENWLNLAERVTDGQKLYVYTKEETLQMQTEDHGVLQESVPEPQNLKVDINKASRDVLMTLPGIGESRADDIIRYREEHGAFQSIEEIQNISGIKNAVFSKIKELITVE